MKHTSVLLHESIDNLNLAPGKTYFDGTLGAAGHVQEVEKRFGPTVRIIAVDRDAGALRHAEEIFRAKAGKHDFILSDYRAIDRVLAQLGVEHVDAILIDLGLSSDQLESSGRGFSFKHHEPLKMTFAEDTQSRVTAETIVNLWREETIADILYGYADERYARRIAKAIVSARTEKPIQTTDDLVAIVEGAVPLAYRKGKIHPATKTFQALRIAVNDEIGALKEGLEKGWQALVPGGRMGIISFHSVEDREVKNFFKDKSKATEGRLIQKKPLVPTQIEVTANPRARSAKLRVIEKIR